MLRRDASSIDVMKVFRSAAAFLPSLVVFLGLAATASGVTTQIGADEEIRAGTLPSAIAGGGFTVQVGEAAGSYAVPAGFGTITAWTHSAGTVPGPLTFKLYRPTGTPQQFVAIASDTRMVTAGSVQSFPVQIPVRPGDRIGLSAEDVQLAFETFNTGDGIGFFSADPALGTTKATDGDPFPEFKLDVAATLESTPAGPASGPSPPAGTPTGQPSGGAGLPAVTILRAAPSAFIAAAGGPSALATKRARSGTRVTYRVNVPTAVRFTVRQVRAGRRSGTGAGARCVAKTRLNRRAPRCARVVTLPGSFSRTARAAGPQRFSFTGRVGARMLKPGAYTLVATPRAGGRSGKSASTRFRITR